MSTKYSDKIDIVWKPYIEAWRNQKCLLSQQMVLVLCLILTSFCDQIVIDVDNCWKNSVKKRRENQLCRIRHS